MIFRVCHASIGINIDKDVLFAFKRQHNQPKNLKQILGHECYSFCICPETNEDGHPKIQIRIRGYME